MACLSGVQLEGLRIKTFVLKEERWQVCLDQDEKIYIHCGSLLSRWSEETRAEVCKAAHKRLGEILQRLRKCTEAWDESGKLPVTFDDSYL